MNIRTAERKKYMTFLNQQEMVNTSIIMSYEYLPAP